MLAKAENALKAADEGQGFLQLREERFFGFELGGVDTATEAVHFYGMLEVQHLVVEQVFDGVTRAGGAVEDAADDDGVVGGVVVAERTFGVVLAPGKLGAAEQSAEEAEIQRVEDFIEMVEAALGTEVAFGAAGVADELGLSRDGRRRREAFVAGVVGGVDVFLVQLGEEDVSDGVDDGFGRAFKQVGEADEDLAFTQADGGIERSEPAEPDRDGRHGSARTECAVFLLKYWGEIGGHGCF